MPRGKTAGLDRERKLKARLEAEGWFVIRAAASLGFADLVALKIGSAPRMIEVKSPANTRSAYADFPPADRAALLDAADKAGAEAWLALWRPHGQLQWIPSSQWPVHSNDKET